jgi:hypothetical protein
MMDPRTSRVLCALCFLAAAVAGWFLPSGADAAGGKPVKSKVARQAVPDQKSKEDALPPADLDEEVVALEAMKEEDQQIAALRSAERLFRRNPADALRFAQWMRRKWPEMDRIHTSDWTLLSPTIHTTDDKRLYGLYGFHGLEQLLRDPQSMLEGKNKQLPWNFINMAARQNPEAFLAMIGPHLSGPMAKDLFAYWPSSVLRGDPAIPFDGPLKECLLTEIASGPQGAAAADSMGLLMGMRDLNQQEMVSVMKSILARQDIMAGAGSQSMESLAWRVARSNPEQIVSLLEGSGKYRERILAGLVRADVEFSRIKAALLPEEQAHYLIERLGNNPRRSQEDVDVAVVAAFAATGETAAKESKALVETLTAGAFNPAMGLQSALQQPTGAARDAFISALVAKWAAVDVVGASAALAALPAGTVPDSAVAGIMTEIRSDPQAVITWAGRMNDRDEGRKAALKAVEDAPVSLQKQLGEQVARLWPAP